MVVCTFYTRVWKLHLAECGRHLDKCRGHLYKCGRHLAECGRHLAEYGGHLAECGGHLRVANFLYALPALQQEVSSKGRTMPLIRLYALFWKMQIKKQKMATGRTIAASQAKYTR